MSKQIQFIKGPEGSLIGQSCNKWVVEERIGSGACGAVHALERKEIKSSLSGSNFNMQFAIKVVKLPERSKGKKNKKSAAERNADLLHYEYNLYNNVFSSLRGRFIPEVPSYEHRSKSPPGFGEINGYRYFVMERMSAPLLEAINIITNMQGTMGEEIEIGHLGVAMVECIEAVHKLRYLFVDIKPENFMLTVMSKKSLKTAKDLAKFVRLIDFGLVESYHDMMVGGHRPDNGCQFSGTPQYGSINVLNGHTPSRRDDLESIAYIVVEMVLMLVERRKPTDQDVLPWSKCQSDDEILQMKLKEIDKDIGKSSVMKRIISSGDNSLGTTITNIFSDIRKLQYDEKPNYENLKSQLKRLVVSTGKRSMAKNNKSDRELVKKSMLTERPIKKHKKGLLSDEDKQNAKEEQNAPRRSKRLLTNGITEGGVIDLTLEKPGIDLNTKILKENAFSTTLIAHDEQSLGSRPPALNMIIISGPHKGESFVLKGEIVVGRNPNTSKNVKKNGKFFFKNDNSNLDVLYAFPKDSEMSIEHAAFTFNSAKKGAVCSVRVKDLNSTNGVYINGKKITKGGHRQAFSGEKIQIGSTVIQIKKSTV